jgi:flagellin
MVALETLRGINKGLGKVQQEVATGKQIANAKDNAAFWAISSVMQSDVSAFKGITETLSLGQATLAVARSGAETVTDLLNEMKGRIVAAQEQNVDRKKIQADVAELIAQVKATVEASQFNGLNLLTNVTDNETVKVLASLNRSATGVTTSTIDVQRKPLEGEGFVNALAGTDGVSADGGRASLQIDEAGGAQDTATFTVVGDNLRLGQTVAVKFGTIAASFVITQAVLDAARETSIAGGGTPTEAEALAEAVATGLSDSLQSVIDLTGVAGDYALDLTNLASGSFDLQNLTANTVAFTAEAGGSNAPLNMIDVSTEEGALSALNMIEGMIQGAIDAAAAMGSSGKRMEIQQEFILKLSDALKSGVGAIIDADMEAASARLQALQVQQQLGTQALSIANQQPQSILSLFQ